MAFAEDLGLVVLILVFIGLYKTFTKGDWLTPSVAFVITILITLILVVPYDWFKYLLFIIIFMTPALSEAKPEQFWKGPKD
ncbi:MAG TPA: hypothetical protein VGQ00_02385 [Candidatus Norongarragalinales archaeon]|jgi:hypothetical protein|nr:hypothetical protein [Candidatus Norongarragalinales archaeon]